MPRQTCVIVKNDLDTEWYSDEKIDNVLSYELRDEKDVVARDAISFERSDDFNKTLSEAANLARKGKKVLMPINIHGDHWVGGMMKMEGEKLKFFHNDSLGNAMDPTMKKKIERAGIEIIDLEVRQQKDNHNCGPLTIHNLLEMSKAESLDDEEELKRKLLESVQVLNLQKLREYHSGLSAYESDKTKEKKICGEMRGIFKNLQEQGKVSEENGNKRFDCNSSKDAKELAEKIKKSYENLGVPCNLQEKDGQWIVKIPAACKGKDVFLMDSDQLEALREEIQDEKSVASEKSGKSSNPICGKFTKMVQKEGKEAKGKASDGRE